MFNLHCKIKMNKLLYNLMALVLIVGIGACDFSVSGDLGVRSADKEYMALLIKELDSASISYRIDREGFIRYPKSEKARFDTIQARVQKMLFKLSPGSGGRVHSTDPEYMRLLKKELDSAGVEYEVDNEGFVLYSMADKQRFKSIQSKVDKIACAGCKDKAKR